MATIYVNEGVSIAVGDNDPDNLKYLNLAEAELPALQEMTAKQHGGGAIAEVEWGALGIQGFECKFGLDGFDPQAVTQFGLFGVAALPYTVRGIFRDKQSGDAVPLRAIVRGRMVDVGNEAMKRGSLFGHKLAVKEVVHYELYFNNQEIIFWDHFASIWRVRAVDMNAQLRAYLAIP